MVNIGKYSNLTLLREFLKDFKIKKWNIVSSYLESREIVNEKRSANIKNKSNLQNIFTTTVSVSNDKFQDGEYWKMQETDTSARVFKWLEDNIKVTQGIAIKWTHIDFSIKCAYIT